METQNDYSYGVIPVRKVGDQWEVFLIHQFSRIGDNTYWVFPKGHAEGEEAPMESASRELLEETGMKAEQLLAKPTFSLAYSFTFDGVLINKQVQFFIGIVSDQSVKLQADEVKEAGWYSLEAAASRLDYQDTKAMFSEVRNFLESWKGA